MKKAFLIISFILAAVSAVPLCHDASLAADEEIKLYVGELKIIPVNSLTRIAIGNPAIADVVNVSKTEMTINPKVAGSTTLVFWDVYGEQSYKLRVFAEDIQLIKRRVDNLLSKLSLPGISTQAEEDEGKVLILGTVKIPQDRERIALALGALKNKTVDLINVKEVETAVEIDVQVLELDKDATTTLGFTFPGSVALTEAGAAVNPALSAASGTGFSSLFRVLSLYRGSGGTATPFAFALDALVQEGKARVLSRPRLACQSGKEAELLVGGEKPIFTTNVASAGGEGTSVEYKEYGIKLKIKPTVTDTNRIKVALNVDITETGTVESIGSTTGSSTVTTAKAYPLTKRTVATELYMDNGQTLAVGGLIKQREEEDVRKTPWLGDLPVLGALFRKKTTNIGGGLSARGNVELFITLTPKIVNEKPETPVAEGQKEATPKATVSSVVEAEENVPEELKGYVSIVQKRIIDNISYPLSAKEAGFQGTVKLGLHLSYLGQVIDATVKQSSGYKILDDNAVTVARQLISFPPFPASIEKKDIWIDVPITYRLD